MPATLRTLKATVDADGVVRLLQPLELDGPAEAVLTVLVPSREPNTTTVAALEESLDDLPRFTSAADLLQDLEK